MGRKNYKPSYLESYTGPVFIIKKNLQQENLHPVSASGRRKIC